METFCETHSKPIEPGHVFCEVCEGEHERIMEHEDRRIIVIKKEEKEYCQQKN